jgi:hypothetical protein
MFFSKRKVFGLYCRNVSYAARIASAWRRESKPATFADDEKLSITRVSRKLLTEGRCVATYMLPNRCLPSIPGILGQSKKKQNNRLASEVGRSNSIDQKQELAPKSSLPFYLT